MKLCLVFTALTASGICYGKKNNHERPLTPAREIERIDVDRCVSFKKNKCLKLRTMFLYKYRKLFAENSWTTAVSFIEIHELVKIVGLQNILGDFFAIPELYLCKIIYIMTTVATFKRRLIMDSSE